MTTASTPFAEDTGTDDLAGLDPMERTIQSTLRESAPEIAADEPITGRPRNATGQFVAQAEGAQPGDWNVIPDATDPAVEGEPAPIVIPEGHAAIPALPPEKVQGFKVLDAEGEIQAPDLKFELSFRRGDKDEQRTVDLPQLVNYARQGVYNHEREQQVIQTRNENQSLQQSVQHERTAVQQYRVDRERLLSDPDYLVAQLQAYQQANTPEAVAERQKQDIQTQRDQLEYDRAAQVNMSYLDGQVAPALHTIVTALPGVTQAELADQLAHLIRPYTVQTRFGTILNPNSFPDIERVIVQHLVPWAQQLHTDKESRNPPAAPAPKPVVPDPKVAALQTQLAKTKRVATTSLKPTGNAAQPSGQAAKPTSSSNRDIESFIIAKSLGTGRG